MDDFGKTLRELREKRGLSVNQLGIYSEVSAALISKIENNKRGIPKPPTIVKLAKGLKMPKKELMELAGYLDTVDSEHVDDEADFAYENLQDEVTNKFIREVVEKYNVDLTVPDNRDKLESIVKLLFDDQNKQ